MPTAQRQVRVNLKKLLDKTRKEKHLRAALARDKDGNVYGTPEYLPIKLDPILPPNEEFGITIANQLAVQAEMVRGLMGASDRVWVQKDGVAYLLRLDRGIPEIVEAMVNIPDSPTPIDQGEAVELIYDEGIKLPEADPEGKVVVKPPEQEQGTRTPIKEAKEAGLI